MWFKNGLAKLCKRAGITAFDAVPLGIEFLPVKTELTKFRERAGIIEFPPISKDAWAVLKENRV